MRIRTKLLCILLALLLPPLVAVSLYALREARLLGDELAVRATDSFKQAATRELTLMVDLIGEDVSDNRQMQELSLALLVQEAGRALASPPTPIGPIFFTTDGDTPKRQTTTEAPSFDLPAGVSRESILPDAARLTRLLPTLDILRQKLRENMLWAYVALPNGLSCAYPGQGYTPPGYDARTRPWYTAALARGGLTWSILVDAATGSLIATASAPIYEKDGTVLGVAGIDTPLAAMLPESDLSTRWGDGVRALIVETSEQPTGPEILVLGSRNFVPTSHDWETPVTPSLLPSPDAASLHKLGASIQANRPDQVELSLNEGDYFAVFKPFPDTPAGLLVLVPRQAIVRQADSAGAAILERSQDMIAIVTSFTLVAVGAAVILAFFGARVVTRPVTALSIAAARLAGGDLSAQTPVTGRDELGQLAATFNKMAPKLAERLRLKQDMQLAMEVQQNLLPKAPPTLPGLDIAGATFFCDETGGDYFDYLQFTPQPGNGCDVVIGDVTGHGISAALFMATGRALLRGGLGGDPDPAALLTLVNGLLCRDTQESGRFLTLFFLRLQENGLEPNGHLIWSRAGHDPAVLYDPATDAFEELLGPGLPLGVLPDYVYEEQSRPGLLPGQVLALGTDGIWEARDPAGVMYGKERFRDVLRKNAGASAEAIVAAVHKDVVDFQAEAPCDDDITLVVVKALPF